jgi:hypothetical protein
MINLIVLCFLGLSGVVLQIIGCLQGGECSTSSIKYYRRNLFWTEWHLGKISTDVEINDNVMFFDNNLARIIYVFRGQLPGTCVASMKYLCGIL